ncbi:peptidoglycan-binding protein [Streptomyces sp. NPDC057554]|uniref:peptidoglycan-binding domain-containing protein n=1 Tax=Streptomyces sp. NPDC057554 TaxID=3350538 RepID=UPI003683F85B
MLTLGSTGPEVADLQRRLDLMHLYHGAYDGVYDEDVATAVHRFQWIRGIDEPAGMYGPATRAALLTETGPARRRA